ncbi:hypothetical protein ACFWUQ_22340 [Streptomyces sp. NPDC058662]|uniref:hypothetical protein n=1 Tax=Streptomyces sp. NPDC058662 TaxID=3346583 RepID=UPI00365B3987
MYRMCAEATAGQGELLWHVLAQKPSSHTLCGRHTPDGAAVLAAMSAAVDRYCPPCLAALRTAVQHRADLAQRPVAARLR